MSRHGGSDDEGSRSALFEVRADGFGAVEGAVEIGLDDFVPGLDGAVEDARVGCATGVGDEGVDLAEFFDHLGHEGGDGFPVADIAFVGFDFNAVFLGELFGVLEAAVGAGCAVGGGC